MTHAESLDIDLRLLPGERLRLDRPDYEARNIDIPEAEPSAVLRLLMEQHDLRQSDLANIFGSQSNVSEVLRGKREINARQARTLGKRFGVSPAVFI
jgi:HTH-type transcriptional regulator/antitoxin HigA